MTTIAAIVCGHTFERWGDIQQAIGSLQSQTRPADQIIFSVDNNEELYEAARIEFPTVTVLHNQGPRGVSAARNTAARATTCEVIAYLDDDATADQEWIEHLIGWYDDATVVGVGGTAIPAWDGDPDGPSWFPASFNWVIGCSHSGIGATAAPVRNFIGCNMSVRRSAWEAVGGFDVRLGRVGADGAGGDETDFCMRITETVGGTIMNDPAAIVTHRVPASRQTLSYFLKRCRSEGRSKAQITARAGADTALSEERNHLLSELPKSFARGLGDGLRGDLAGISRSGSIVLGTGATGLGFLTGRFKQQVHAPDQSIDFVPVAVLTINLNEEVDQQFDSDDEGRPAFLIVRRGNQLLGTRTVDSLPSPSRLKSLLQADYPQTADTNRPSNPTQDRTATIVIATRDRADSLRRCLDSLLTMTRLADQTIVVDSASSDSSTETMVEHWRSETNQDITYVRCTEPGLAVAHNASLPFVSSDIVAFTDDDVIVDEHWLERILAGFDTSEQVACVTGAIMPAEIDTWPQAWVESTSNFTKGFETRTFSAAAPPDDPLFPFTAGSMGSGANMAFSYNWLRANDGFNAALGAGTTALGGDDLRAFYDVIKSGGSVHFTPDALVFHHHHRTPEAIDRQAHGYGAGLGAFLTSVVVDDPPAALCMLRQARGAVTHAAKVSAPAADGFPGDRRRSRRQRIGMLSGPFRYLRSRQ